jgi:hypothetical protein
MSGSRKKFPLPVQFVNGFIFILKPIYEFPAAAIAETAATKLIVDLPCYHIGIAAIVVRHPANYAAGIFSKGIII